jgi:hypothetical protein
MENEYFKENQIVEELREGDIISFFIKFDDEGKEGYMIMDGYYFYHLIKKKFHNVKMWIIKIRN